MKAHHYALESRDVSSACLNKLTHHAGGDSRSWKSQNIENCSISSYFGSVICRFHFFVSISIL